MPASEAQLAANRLNSLKSTGPKTPEGKAASSANALTHGLTAARLIPELEAAEVDRRGDAFVAELAPTGAIGEALARHAARRSVRMERYGEHENALMLEHVRQALADFVPPEGASPAEVAVLRMAVQSKALFDASREVERARKYELAAERGFFRALKELRLHEGAVKRAEAEMFGEKAGGGLGSFPPGEDLDAEFDAILREEARPARRTEPATVDPVGFPSFGGRVDVPITIGKRR